MSVPARNGIGDWLPDHLHRRVDSDVPLAPITWFRVGGPAKILFKPKTITELSEFMQCMPWDMPYATLGVGSNVLIRDGGFDGVVIRLAGDFTKIEIEDENRVRVGAAALDVAVARLAAKHCVAGLEFLRGIPGTIGGALRMNAGAYGREIKDVLVEATAVGRDGELQRLMLSDLNYGYRSSGADEKLVFTGAVLCGAKGTQEEIRDKMDQITEARESSQPIRSRTGGSTFKNPPADQSAGRRAWELIDEAGCRGLRNGGAQVSEQHCNFLINHGDATSKDLEELGETVRRKVLEKTSVSLDWEIKRLGQEAPSE